MTFADDNPVLYLWWVCCDDAQGRPVGVVVTRACCGSKAAAVAMRTAWPVPDLGQHVKIDAVPVDPRVMFPDDMMRRLLTLDEAMKGRFIIESQDPDAPTTKN